MRSMAVAALCLAAGCQSVHSGLKTADQARVVGHRLQFLSYNN